MYQKWLIPVKSTGDCLCDFVLELACIVVLETTVTSQLCLGSIYALYCVVYAIF